jgi:YVTN family beta-propeller protein
VDPVSLALRPDGSELWVSNHISDTVSVIDLNRQSSTFHQIIHTIQDIDEVSLSTRFDEPCGIAFADNDKAYVALSSENQIAVIDTHTYQVIRKIKVAAQDPRTIKVHNKRLYVLPFESNNRTQLSGGSEVDGDLVTFNAWEHSIHKNNVLSIGHVTDIVKHPDVPDRDLFIFDTITDEPVIVVNELGTLLYGLAVDSSGTVYISQTDARNEVNGRAGSKGHTLKELDNRMFLNRVTKIDFQGNSHGPGIVSFMDLEPPPPKAPLKSEALATPYAIEVSDDGDILYITAAGSDMFFTVDAQSGEVMHRIKTGFAPRSMAIDGGLAWVHNAVANSVSIIDINNPLELKREDEILLPDPTDTLFMQGRKAFNSAMASSTGTFSCASCHPDGHTDQLLWVLNTPIVTGGNQIMPRSTMPVRGLRDTEPFHWDGIPGDPYGGINSANIHSPVAPNSASDDPLAPIRHLIDGGLASTMRHGEDMIRNDEGKPGYISSNDREAMAYFLLNISYPPAQRRPFNNQLSERAKRGFELFHITGDKSGTPGSNLCGNCHRMPFWVSSNTPGTGMDAPTWRGAYDRFLILPQGRLNIIDFDFYRRVAERGAPEKDIWRFSWGGRKEFDPVWDMVLEGSTGFSGAFGRQWTLNESNAGFPLSRKVINALEKAAADESISLYLRGQIVDGVSKRTVHCVFKAENQIYSYRPLHSKAGQTESFYSYSDFESMAIKGTFLGTWTAYHNLSGKQLQPQPALWTQGPIHSQSGKQAFPRISEINKSMKLSGRHVSPGAILFVNGKRVNGTVQLGQGDLITIELKKIPRPGIHFLQIQNPSGLLSNDFIFHVSTTEEKEADLQDELILSIAQGNFEKVRQVVDLGASPNIRARNGKLPLSTAAMHGRTTIAALLLNSGADPDLCNDDGNTPLHIAAFFCREDIVSIFLENDASTLIRNKRGETAADVVRGAWSPQLRGFYTGLNNHFKLGLDTLSLPKRRQKILETLERIR